MPLDELNGALAPFGASTGLPRDAYRSREVLEWETAAFFAGTWSCVGRISELVGPGQARGIRVGAESVLLTNDGEATHAFSNVCRHRGHELAPIGAAFDARLVRCPYHSWSYRLDGSLNRAPTFSGRGSFDERDYPLIAFATAAWQGWLFVNLDGAAGPLDDQLGNLDVIVSAYAIGGLVAGHIEEYEVAANWKLLIENFNECYHCTSIHPALCDVTPVESGADLAPTGLWCGGTMGLKPHAATMSMDGTTLLPLLPGVGGDLARRVLYVTLFPNLLISAHPDYVLVHRLIPLAPDRTGVECTWLFPEDIQASEGFDPSYAVDFWDLTNREDWSVCEGVQRGLANTGYRPGPLSTWEATVYQFVTMVGRAYRGRGLTPSQVASRSVAE